MAIVGTHGRVSGIIRASDIRNEFYENPVANRIPISRYLRAPGGVLVPDLPVNQKVKNVTKDIQFSDYYMARFWYLSLTFISAKTESYERYHTNNDGEVQILIEGTSTEYSVSYPSGGSNVSQVVKNKSSFRVSNIDGDAGIVNITLTDPIKDIDGIFSLPSGVSPPTYTIGIGSGFDQDRGNQGISYFNNAIGVGYTAYFPGSKIYLPWTSQMVTNTNRLIALSVTFPENAQLNPSFVNGNDNYTVAIPGQTLIGFTYQSADPSNIVEVFVQKLPPLTTDKSVVKSQTATGNGYINSIPINPYPSETNVWLVVYSTKTSKEDLSNNTNNCRRVYKIVVNPARVGYST